LPLDDARLQFELTVMPHLDAAMNLARWLTRDGHDAEDVVQEACLRALRFIHTQRGQNNRAWLLTIVRNTCCTWLEKNRPSELARVQPLDAAAEPATDAAGPETLAIARADRESVRRAVEELPLEYREVIVLRELEEMSYKEVAQIVGVPLGTVMSRLSRGRARLERWLTGRQPQSLSENRPQTGGQSPYPHRASEKGTVPDGSRPGSNPKEAGHELR
jgi:RNA polymerase sigma-70 factor, ECF subfamily